ncbi:F-box only protein 36b [Denticeps clupeoides]|uniref:F-box domain-containing protein n=1 Tax=Denticeps clupeoides TaxID=299321 RepID=A0AAY4ADJ7_9TELE|nr:F-box only protein 36 [Denticeps clupeoides]
MARLLGETLFQISGQGPAPSKDFFHLEIKKSDVTWRWWRISPRNENKRPGEVVESHTCFLEDRRLQDQVRLVFGTRVLRYITNLCQGHFDYLEHLPNHLLLQIMTYLDLEDIAHLRQTSHRLKMLCDSEEFWEHTVRQTCKTVPEHVEMLARELGWRTVFFTNKLQLQKQISRRRRGLDLLEFEVPLPLGQ